jgi:hypothetical protein
MLNDNVSLLQKKISDHILDMVKSLTKEELEQLPDQIVLQFKQGEK